MNFSDLHPTKGEKSEATVLRTLAYAVTAQHKKLDRALRRLPASRSSRLRDVLIGDTSSTGHYEMETLHSSQIGLREAFSRHAIKTLPQLFSADDKPRYFVTFLDERYETSEAEPIVRLTDMRRRFAQCMNILGFGGFAVIEFDMLRNPRADGKGGTISAHAHGMGYFKSKGFRRRAKKLAASKRLRHQSGIRTVKIKRIKDTLGDAALVAFYCTKPFYRAKRQSPPKIEGGRVRRRTCKPTARHVVRIIELMSYLSFRDLLIASGKFGWMCRKALIQALGPAGKTRRTPMTPAKHIHAFWRDYWHAAGRPHYAEVIIE